MSCRQPTPPCPCNVYGNKSSCTRGNPCVPECHPLPNEGDVVVPPPLRHHPLVLQAGRSCFGRVWTMDFCGLWRQIDFSKRPCTLTTPRKLSSARPRTSVQVCTYPLRNPHLLIKFNQCARRTFCAPAWRTQEPRTHNLDIPYISSCQVNLQHFFPKRPPPGSTGMACSPPLWSCHRKSQMSRL